MEILGDYDYKATKPVFLAVAKLHKHVEPRLGDLWLLRHDETARLRKLLWGLYEVVPVTALMEIINEVGNELEHIKQQMSEYPPRHGTRRWGELQGSITPSESPSVRVLRHKNLEGRSGSYEDTDKRTKIFSRSKHTDNFQAPPELSGSDLDPPHFIIAQSTRLVEDWLDECDFSMVFAVSEEKEPLVSLLGGGVVARPAMEVPFWRRRLITASMFNTTAPHSRITNKVAKASDCVYDRPFQPLGLDSMGVEQLNKPGTIIEEKARRDRFIVKLPAFLCRKKIVKQETSDEQDSTNNNDVSLHRNDQTQEHEDWEALMTGGRSSKHSVSMVAFVPASRRISSSTERYSQGQQASTLSNINKSHPQISAATGNTGSDLTMSSTLSSRSSNINFGSIIEHPISPSELADRERRETECENSPEIFVPTALEPTQQENARYFDAAKQLTRKPSFDSFRPSTPKPIEHAYVSPSKAKQTPREGPEMPIREPGRFVSEKAQLGGAGEGISMLAMNRERRRADRTSNGTGEFRRPEGRTANVYEIFSEFTKNRERRRSERLSAGPVLETKGASEAKMASAKNKHTKATKALKVEQEEEEEVASGAAWERRMKKAQVTSKKSFSDKYRAEERQKYWSLQK